MGNRHAWLLLGVLPLAAVLLGLSHRAVTPAGTQSFPVVTSPVVRSTQPPHLRPIVLRVFRGKRADPCHVCARKIPRHRRRDPRHLESPRALPPVKNRGRLPVAAALRPHDLGSLFGVGSFVMQRNLWLTNDLVGRVRLLGANWVREEMTASLLHVGPHAPYHWAPFDRVVDRERRAGLNVLGLLDYSNTWRFRNHGTMPHFAIARLSRDFARYAIAVARHFRGRIRCWQVWNEPNLKTFWHPQPNPEDYAHLLTAASRAIKQVDPHATIVMGGMSGVDLPFLRAVTAYTRSFDVIAVHPYRVTPEDRLLRQIAALRGFHRPVWFTEIGWAASRLCPLCTDEQTQAGNLVRFYTLAAGAGVRRIFWYDLRDDPHVPANPEGHFGLLRRDLSGKPAFTAFGFLARALSGARFVTADALNLDGVYALRFHTMKGTVVVLWNTAPSDRMVLLPWTMPHADLLSLDGHALMSPVPRRGTVSIQLSATADPVYLVSFSPAPVSMPGPLLYRAHHTILRPGRRKPQRPHSTRRVYGTTHRRAVHSARRIVHARPTQPISIPSRSTHQRPTKHPVPQRTRITRTIVPSSVPAGEPTPTVHSLTPALPLPTGTVVPALTVTAVPEPVPPGTDSPTPTSSPLPTPVATLNPTTAN